MLNTPTHTDVRGDTVQAGPQQAGCEAQQYAGVGGSADTQHPAAFILSCVIAFCISAAATIYFSVSMSGTMEMTGGWTMSMMWMRMPGQSWPASAAMFLLMWELMMIAMMLPSLSPMLFSYRRTLYSQGAASAGMKVFVAAAGYFFVWLIVGMLAYAAGMPFSLATMASPGLSKAVPPLAVVTLIIAGGIQFTSWKMRELKRCRELQSCIPMQVANKIPAPWRVGLSEGRSCVICTSGLMLVLLTLGAMNLAVMAVVTIMVATEKLIPKPVLFVRLFGATAIAAGLFMAGSLFF